MDVGEWIMVICELCFCHLTIWAWNLIIFIEIPERERAEKHRVMRLTLRKLIRARVLYYMKNKRQVIFSRRSSQHIRWYFGLKNTIEDCWFNQKTNSYNFFCKMVGTYQKITSPSQWNISGTVIKKNKYFFILGCSSSL